MINNMKQIKNKKQYVSGGCKIIKCYQKKDINPVVGFSNKLNNSNSLLSMNSIHMKSENYNGIRYIELCMEDQLVIKNEEDKILLVLISYMKNKKYYKNTVTELLKNLEDYANNNQINSTYEWSKSVAGFSNKLNNSKSLLYMNGIHMKREKYNGIRYIELCMEDQYKEVIL